MAEQKPPKPAGKKPEKTIDDLLNRDSQMMRSPLLWFVLLGVPVIICFYIGLRQEGADASARHVRKEIIQYTPDKPQAQNVEKEQYYNHRSGGGPKCSDDYMDLVGKPADEALQARLKAENKAFRILPPKAIRTMEYSRERINFDVDADGKITRVWCG